MRACASSFFFKVEIEEKQIRSSYVYIWNCYEYKSSHWGKKLIPSRLKCVEADKEDQDAGENPPPRSRITLTMTATETPSERSATFYLPSESMCRCFRNEESLCAASVCEDGHMLPQISTLTRLNTSYKKQLPLAYRRD